MRSSLRPRFCRDCGENPRGQDETIARWRDTAARLRKRSDEFERKAEALEHALNLLLNNGLVAFRTDMTQDGPSMIFYSSSHPVRRSKTPSAGCGQEGNNQDFPIVLWRTKFEAHGGIVPMNHSNKVEQSMEESEEGRPLIKENILATQETQPLT